MTTVEKLFNEFHPKYIKEGRTNNGILKACLDDFVEEIATHWNEHCTMDYCRAHDEISGSKPLFEIEKCSDFFGSNAISTVVTENGTVYSMTVKYTETGTVSWNGDDVYYTEYKAEYENIKKIGIITNIRELGDTMLTSEKMENIACEVVSFTCQ